VSRPTPLATGRVRTALYALIVGALVFLVLFQQKSYRRGGVKVGSEAPPFALTELRTGERIDLDAQRGKPVLLVFWATWCDPCKEELPHIDALHRELGDRVSILTIVNEPAPVVKEFLSTRRQQGEDYAFPVLVDDSGRIHVSYDARNIPYSVLIDAKGAIADSFVGQVDEDDLRTMLLDLVGGS
jgi:thiol-disulfide isomerase/thioredoxin